MPRNLDFNILLPSFAIAGAVFTGLWLWLRARRIRGWQRMLAESPPSVRTRTVVKKSFPAEVDLPNDQTAFEALHSHLQAQVRSASSPVLLRAVAQLESGSNPRQTSTVAHLRAPLSEEDKAKALVGGTRTPLNGGLLPTEALAENAVVNLLNVLKGKKKLTVGIEHAVLDSLGAAGGAVGSKAGIAAGLASASLLTGISLPIVPVLAVAGALLGALAGKHTGERIKNWRYYSALRQLRGVARQFKKWFLCQFPEFIAVSKRESKAAIAQNLALFKDQQNGLMRFLWPDLTSCFLKMNLTRLKSEHVGEIKRLKRLRQAFKAIEPLQLVSILEELNGTGNSQEGLQKHLEAYRAAQDAIEAAQAIHPSPNETRKSA